MTPWCCYSKLRFKLQKWLISLGFYIRLVEWRALYWWLSGVATKYPPNSWCDILKKEGLAKEEENMQLREGEITRSVELLGLIPPCSATLYSHLIQETPLATQLQSQISAKVPPPTLDREWTTAAEGNVVLGVAPTPDGREEYGNTILHQSDNRQILHRATQKYSSKWL